MADKFEMIIEDMLTLVEPGSIEHQIFNEQLEFVKTPEGHTWEEEIRIAKQIIALRSDLEGWKDGGPLILHRVPTFLMFAAKAVEEAASWDYRKAALAAEKAFSMVRANKEIPGGDDCNMEWKYAFNDAIQIYRQMLHEREEAEIAS